MGKLLIKLKDSYDSIDYQKSILLVISDLIMIISGIVLLGITIIPNLHLSGYFFLLWAIILCLIVAPILSLIFIYSDKLKYGSYFGFLPVYLFLLSTLFVTGGIDSFILPMVIIITPMGLYSLNKKVGLILCFLTISLISSDLIFGFSDLLPEIAVNKKFLDVHKLASIILAIVCLALFVSTNANKLNILLKESLGNQKHLENKKAELSSIFKAYPDLLLRFNSECEITAYYSNPATEKDFDLKTRTSKNLNELVSDRDVSLLRETLKRAIDRDKMQRMEFFLKGNKSGFYELRLVPLNKDEVIGIIRDVTIRKKAEKRLVEAVRERGLLVKEIHHRVKNNMQLIVSLISLQTHYLSEHSVCIHSLKQAQKRVVAMGLIHKILYQSKKLDKINFKNYIDNLMDDIFKGSRQSQVKVETDIDESVYFNMDTSIPLGLIVNEIVSNSLNHAFNKDIKSPTITINLVKVGDNHLTLTVRDNGCGLPSNFLDMENITTMGLDVIYTLTSQLDSSILVKNDNGARFTLDLCVPIFYNSEEAKEDIFKL